MKLVWAALAEPRKPFRKLVMRADKNGRIELGKDWWQYGSAIFLTQDALNQIIKAYDPELGFDTVDMRKYPVDFEDEDPGGYCTLTEYAKKWKYSRQWMYTILRQECPSERDVKLKRVRGSDGSVRLLLVKK